MKVHEIMSRDVHVASPQDSLRDAALVMKRIDSGFLPVGENDRLVGTITDRDMAIRGLAEGKGPEERVASIMTADVKYCFDDQEVEEVLENMGKIQVRRLPVVNREKRLVGVLSLGDAARSRAETSEVAETLEEISGPAR